MTQDQREEGGHFPLCQTNGASSVHPSPLVPCAMPQEYCQASSSGMYCESTNYALRLVTSPERSSSSSTVSGIVGVDVYVYQIDYSYNSEFSGLYDKKQVGTFTLYR